MNPAQQEQLLNIGTYLQDIRKEKGKAIDEVANQIFIRPALVRAIEAGDWESLPEPVFVQGFIRRYAEYLGLNGREISQKFEPTPVSVLPNPELANSGTVEGVVKQQDKHGLKVLSKADPPQNGSSLSQGNGAHQNWNWLIGVTALAALVGLIVWLTTRNTPQRALSDSPEEQVTTTDESAEESAPTAPTAEPAPETASPETATTTATETPSAPITFAVNVEADSWMRIVVDGEEVYEGILTAGTQESWTAEDQLTVTAGNSGGVMYSFNGSDEAPLGNPGAVSNLTLTPETDPQTLPAP